MTAAEQSLSRLAAQAPAGEPAFAAALRRAGAEAFARLGLPTVRHEEWLYTSLAALSALELAPAAAGRLDAAALARLGGLPRPRGWCW